MENKEVTLITGNKVILREWQHSIYPELPDLRKLWFLNGDGVKSKQKTTRSILWIWGIQSTFQMCRISSWKDHNCLDISVCNIHSIHLLESKLWVPVLHSFRLREKARTDKIHANCVANRWQYVPVTIKGMMHKTPYYVSVLVTAKVCCFEGKWRLISCPLWCNT